LTKTTFEGKQKLPLLGVVGVGFVTKKGDRLLFLEAGRLLSFLDKKVACPFFIRLIRQGLQV
jgi:hypothetical protein